jgi:hypothetical protein
MRAAWPARCRLRPTEQSKSSEKDPSASIRWRANQANSGRIDGKPAPRRWPHRRQRPHIRALRALPCRARRRITCPPGCGRGGTGRHTGLKILRRQRREGSSPSVRTNFCEYVRHGAAACAFLPRSGGQAAFRRRALSTQALILAMSGGLPLRRTRWPSLLAANARTSAQSLSASASPMAAGVR